jgi:hypothetical protein
MDRVDARQSRKLIFNGRQGSQQRRRKKALWSTLAAVSG